MNFKLHFFSYFMRQKLKDYVGQGIPSPIYLLLFLILILGSSYLLASNNYEVSPNNDTSSEEKKLLKPAVKSLDSLSNGVLKELAMLPILDKGRVKPLSSYAQNLLLQFSGKSTYQKKPALSWMIGFLFNPWETRDDEIFLINHSGVLDALELKLPQKRRFSLLELEPGLNRLNEIIPQIEQIESKDRSEVEAEILRVYQNLSIYINLFPTFRFFEPVPDFTLLQTEVAKTLDLPAGYPLSYYDLVGRVSRLAPFLQKISDSPQDSLSPTEAEALRISKNMYQQSSTYKDLPFHVMTSAVDTGIVYTSPWDAIHERSTEKNEYQKKLQLWEKLYIAYHQKNPDLFASSAQELVALGFQTLKKPYNSQKIQAEQFYNQLKPFFYAKVLFILAFLVALLGLMVYPKLNLRICLAIVLFGFGLITLGLGLRMYIMARPPVTNLFETFVFVGWICVILGLFIEWLNRRGLGLLTASLSGVIMLMISGKYAREGDTMGMLVAVLDSNFWLSTHVVTITMGYAGCIAAGIIGHFYLLQWTFGKNNDSLKSIAKAMYGVLAFGLVLSFIGTVLGGIWADQSWGRFWGWDPKENGALLIVLWCAILFHSRFDGMIRDYGMAMGSVFGIMVVMFAWFGVNLLGVGLHSYGFTSGVFINLMVYGVLEIIFMMTMYTFYWRRKYIQKTLAG